MLTKLCQPLFTSLYIMPLILQQLPFEIIELVSLNTSTNDLLNVIQVSKSWHAFFHTFLYRSVSINNHEKLHRILSAFLTGDIAGHYVKSLTLLNVELSQQDVINMTKVFSDIDTFHFDWKIWGTLECHFDSDAPISFIHPPQGLPPGIHHVFQHYGSTNLRHLSIDALNHGTTDIWSILSLCPRLKSLKLLNLNHEHIITLGYMETIHQLCPQLTSLVIKCTRSDPNPTLLPQFSENHDPIILSSTLLESFTLSSKYGSAKWSLWLPYFTIKYPYLKHILFKHSGLGRDVCGSELPDRAYAMFIKNCRQLKSMCWNKIIIHQNIGLFQQKQLNLERIEGYEDFCIPRSLENSPFVQPDISNLLTSLTIGKPPTNTTTSQVIRALGQCKKLTHLKIQECSMDLAYGVDEILIHCQKLLSLYIKDVHVNVNDLQVVQASHPLKKLVLKRASFTQDVFKHISKHCLQLDHVDLLGCFQTDRRDQVVIDLTGLNLKVLNIQGLRTRRYYAGCRIRFFAVSTKKDSAWYYMSQYDVRHHCVGQKKYFQKFRNMEFASCFDKLDDRDVHELKSLVTTDTLKAWDIEAAKRHLPHTLGIDQTCWDPENIYYSGFVNIQCQSVESLIINNKSI